MAEVCTDTDAVWGQTKILWPGDTDTNDKELRRRWQHFDEFLALEFSRL